MRERRVRHRLDGFHVEDLQIGLPLGNRRVDDRSSVNLGGVANSSVVCSSRVGQGIAAQTVGVS
jgi:hypothetical protein